MQKSWKVISIYKNVEFEIFVSSTKERFFLIFFGKFIGRIKNDLAGSMLQTLHLQKNSMQALCKKEIIF